MKQALVQQQARAVESNLSLLSRIRLEEEDAMHRFYDRHASTVYTAALALVEQAAPAEDILHEIFMQVWRSPELFASYGEKLSIGLSVMARRQARAARVHPIASLKDGIANRRSTSYDIHIEVF
jgi:RNA polymerase sigma-70 factor (ECF subfamily)